MKALVHGLAEQGQTTESALVKEPLDAMLRTSMLEMWGIFLNRKAQIAVASATGDQFTSEWKALPDDVWIEGGDL